MIIDSHQHVILPTSMQLEGMDRAGVGKAVLFATTPHVERAKSAALADIDREMQALYRLLGGAFTEQQRRAQMEGTIEELKQAVATAPDRFAGFGPVPLGLSDDDTAAWVEDRVVGNAFRGIGEFTPGSTAQVEQLEPVFRAASDHAGLPLWVHTFNPVAPDGIAALMDLCRRYPSVPVIFGHGGGYSWMDVTAFAKRHPNAYVDLSAAFTPLSVKTALFEVPEQCLFSSDAPFGEPELSRRLVEFASPSPEVTALALGGNTARLLGL
ncbi:amidohydrolase [Gordonibacter sp. 28C]|uniref:amidohydrolase family protein n=1 Tax=Gordonibacter sp. 28C TaxID=2078569 RepID=UPI000DF76546|nr:amidohydrolase family protein [Gordonibacter sp. 28C]RDB64303.1 amidohydrolase [Gordonibacter sp. 28C]